MIAAFRVCHPAISI
jgi:hypothetical protein